MIWLNTKDLFSLKGKTAIVTGGGRGSGQQISVAYAEAGANVVVCSRNLDACQGLSEALKEKGVRSLALKCDVSRQEDIQLYGHVLVVDGGTSASVQ